MNEANGELTRDVMDVVVMEIHRSLTNLTASFDKVWRVSAGAAPGVGDSKRNRQGPPLSRWHIAVAGNRIKLPPKRSDLLSA